MLHPSPCWSSTSSTCATDGQCTYNCAVIRTLLLCLYCLLQCSTLIADSSTAVGVRRYCWVSKQCQSTRLANADTLTYIHTVSTYVHFTLLALQKVRTYVCTYSGCQHVIEHWTWQSLGTYVHTQYSKRATAT